jgi:hypothetical protein
MRYNEKWRKSKGVFRWRANRRFLGFQYKAAGQGCFPPFPFPRKIWLVYGGNTGVHIGNKDLIKHREDGITLRLIFKIWAFYKARNPLRSSRGLH